MGDLYNRIEDRKAKALKLKQRQFKAEQKKQEAKQEKQRAEQEKQKQEALADLAYDIDNKISQLDGLAMSEDKNVLIDTLSQLALLLKTNKVKDTSEEKNKIHNKYADAILAKYEHTFMMFITYYSDDKMVPYYDGILKSAKKFRAFKKNAVLFSVLIFLACVVIAGIIASQFS